MARLAIFFKKEKKINRKGEKAEKKNQHGVVSSFSSPPTNKNERLKRTRKIKAKTSSESFEKKSHNIVGQK